MTATLMTLILSTFGSSDDAVFDIEGNDVDDEDTIDADDVDI